MSGTFGMFSLGKSKDWSHLHSFKSADDLAIFCQDENLKRGNVLKSGTFSTTYHKYYTCGVNGCPKQYRSVISLKHIDREEDKSFILEHVAGEAHDHDGVDVVFRGMTSAQRNIVIQYLNRRDGLRYYASAKPMSSFDITGNRRRIVTDVMLPSLSSNRSQLLKVSSQCMELILNYLHIRGICRLDIAITNSADRIDWLSILRVSHVDAIDKMNYWGNKSIRWLVSRDIRLKSLELSREFRDDNKQKLYDLNLSSLLRIHLFHNFKGIDLLSLAHGCPNLSEIFLRGCDGLRNESVIAFSKLCTKMRSVNIFCSRKITDISILAIAQNCPLLSIICISMCEQITDISLLALAQNCPLLSSIEISGFGRISDTGLSAIAQNCPLLNSIKCSRWRISDTGLLAIAQNCPLLCSIDIYGCDEITDAGLLAIAQNCPLLNSFDFSRCEQITDAGLVAIAQQCPLLNSFRIYSCDRISYTGFSATAQNCPKLTRISFYEFTYITDADWVAIAQNCPLLNSIDISGCDRITDAGLLAIAENCPLLTTLNISGCDKISDTGLSALAQNCPKLTSISLPSSANVTSIGLLNLTRGLPHLSNINISGCQWLTNAALVAVGQNCNRLRSIDLSNTDIDDEGVAGIASNCPLLSLIFLDHDIRITERSLTALVEKCPEMKVIKLYNIRGLDAIVSSIRRRYPLIRIQNDLNI